MGCDIHLYVERRNASLSWESADKWTPNRYIDDENSPREVIDYNDRFYSGRSYSLFAILANVRNGVGFAGVDTGDGFVPISEPRGLPKDVSARVKSESERWGSDGHSHSWLTLAELLAYDWTRVTKRRGYVSAYEYWEWTNSGTRKNGGSPESWCGGVGGGVIPEEEMIERLKAYGPNRDYAESIKKNLAHAYCEVEWTQPYYACCPGFWSETIPRLLRVGNPHDVRIVFFFDN